MLKKIKVSNFFICFFSILILILAMVGFSFYKSILETGENLSDLTGINKRLDAVESAVDDLQMSRVNTFAAIAAQAKGNTEEAKLRLAESIGYLDSADKKWIEVNNLPSKVNSDLNKNLSSSYYEYSKAIRRDINYIQEGKENSNYITEEREIQ